jgi:hypothetical protein
MSGTSVTVADFEQKEAGDLLQARYQMYLSERKVLDHFIEGQILELQAKKSGLTVDQLLIENMVELGTGLLRSG